MKKVFLEISQNSQENTCARVSVSIKLQAERPATLLKKKLAQVFSCEFCKIPKNTFSYKTPPVAASDIHLFFKSKLMHYQKDGCNNMISLNKTDVQSLTLQNPSLLSGWLKFL